MRLAAFLVVVILTGACERALERAAAAVTPQPPAPERTVSQAIAFPVRVDHTRFADANGKPFPWRGITAFRLAEMIAGGREQDAVAYLDWAASEKLTVVRVLLMAKHLFTLRPEAGRAALPRLLDLAKARGLTVEVVALADTAGSQLDYDAHLREVGRLALDKGNAFVEIANEPGHSTQDSRLHDPAFVQRLASLLPRDVVVALGSGEYGDGFAAGDYATFHFPRGSKGWEHVFSLSAGARRVAQLGKPVISDEPMGAGPEYQPGRRDNEPPRFAAAAALTQLAGLGATFHYEGGLQARVPRSREAACLDAWQAGLALIPQAAAHGEFLEGARVARVARTAGAQRAFARVSSDLATVLLVDPSGVPSVSWVAGWRETHRSAVPGAVVAIAARARSGP